MSTHRPAPECTPSQLGGVMVPGAGNDDLPSFEASSINACRFIFKMRIAGETTLPHRIDAD